MIKRKFLLLTLVAAFSIFCGYAQDADEWDYPVKPGSEVWKSFTTSKQKSEVLQIPDTVLKKMSTKHLTEVCVNYPMMGDWFFFDDPNIYLENLERSFNGLKELINRPTYNDELLSIYMNFQLKDKDIVNTMTGISNDLKCFHIGYVELLISDPLYISKLSPVQFTTIKNQTVSLYKAKRLLVDSYGLGSLQRSVITLLNINNEYAVIHNGKVKFPESIVTDIQSAKTIDDFDIIMEKLNN